MKQVDNSLGGDADPGQEQPAWIDRHLIKIVVAAAIICGLGLIARALTG